MPYTQENRLIAIDTPLGKDVLLLAGFNGTEGLSRLFSFELDLGSFRPDPTLGVFLGRNRSPHVVQFIARLARAFRAVQFHHIACSNLRAFYLDPGDRLVFRRWRRG